MVTKEEIVGAGRISETRLVAKEKVRVTSNIVDTRLVSNKEVQGSGGIVVTGIISQEDIVISVGTITGVSTHKEVAVTRSSKRARTRTITEHKIVITFAIVRDTASHVEVSEPFVVAVSSTISYKNIIVTTNVSSPGTEGTNKSISCTSSVGATGMFTDESVPPTSAVTSTRTLSNKGVVIAFIYKASVVSDSGK